MNNIKAQASIAIILITSCCNLYAAVAAQKETPVTPTTNVTALSHQEILTHLLMAELAEQKNMLDVALDNYMTVAKYTNNPEVAQLATELALQIPDQANALTASAIWANADKTSMQAQLIALTLWVNSEPNKALNFLNNAFALNTPDIDQQLSYILGKLSATGQKNLTKAVFTIAEQQPKNPYAQLSAAQLAALQLNVEPAEEKLKIALALKPDLTGAIELKAKIIRHLKNSDQPALAYLEQEVAKHPKNSELRMFYITALTDANLTSKAIPQLEVLTKNQQYGGDALVMLGEIAIKNGNYKLAEKNMTAALEFKSATDKAKFYLAQLAENKNNIAQAITWYESVDENSEYHTAAYLRAAYLYSADGNYEKALDALQNSAPNSFEEQKQVLLTEVDILISTKDFDQALENCNKVLDIIPNDADFLYARSVVYGLQNKSAAAEKDLRAILELEPNNVNALNALGFTLTNQPARMNEAMPFLQKAITLSPDNPAFMDSMGWLLYKKGNIQESIKMLTTAYDLSNDAEIAAHLGEVLWAAGKQEAAKKVWNKALSASADNTQIIQDTLSRLNIPITELNPIPNKNMKADAAN